MRESFEALLEESSRTHGHLCPGQVLGVRMSIHGLERIGITDPRGSERKDIIVFVECDRCAADAVQSVTGCTLGKRTLRFADYGKMAATYVNLRTGEAVRVLCREDARDKARERFPEAEDKYKAQAEAYKVMPDEELFDIMRVRVTLRDCDMPGRPLSRIVCIRCGEHVQDSREVRGTFGEAICRACAGESYYEAV